MPCQIFALTTRYIVSGNALIMVIEYFSSIEVHTFGFDCHLVVYMMTTTQGAVSLEIWHPSGSVLQVGEYFNLFCVCIIFKYD